MALLKSKKSLRTFLLLFLMVVIGGVGWSWYRGRTDQLWQRVQNSHAEGRHEAAAIALRSLLRKSPNHAPAHRFLADVLLAQAKQKNPNATFGNFKPAYNELAIAYKLEPQNQHFAQDFMQAEFESASFTSAKLIAKNLLEQDTNNNHARQILAEIALKKDDFATAEKHLAPISREGILKSIALITVKLKVLNHRQDETETQFLYEEILKNSLKTSGNISLRKRFQLNRMIHDAVVTSSDSEQAKRRLDTAIGYFERYGKTGNIGDAALKLVNLVGVLHNRFPNHEMFSSDKFAKIFLCLNKTVSLAIENGQVKSWFYRNASNLMLNFNKNDRALEIAHRGIENLSQPKWKNRFDEEISKLHMLLATQYVSVRKFRSAQPHVEQLLKDARHAGFGHRLAGIICKNEARYSEAFSHFEKARKELKDSLPLRLDMAETCMALKKWRQALPYLKSLHIDRGSLTDEQKIWTEKNLGDGFRVHLQEALCYLSLGQYDLMENKIEVLRDSGFEPQIAMLKAYSLLKQGKSNDAIDYLKSTTSRHPKNHRMMQLLVKILDSANRSKDADRIIDEFEKRNSKNLSVLSFSCFRSMKKGRDEKVERQLENLLKKFPQSPVVWYLKSREALKHNDLKAATVWSAKLAQHAGTESLGTALSTLMELKNRNLENAALLLENNSAENGSAMIDLLQSEVQFQKGNYDEALDSLTSAMRYNRWRKKSSAAIFRSLSTMLRKFDTNEVLKKIDALIAQYPKESLLYMTKTDLHLRQAEYASAMTTLDKLQQINFKSIILPLFKARIFETMKQYKTALQEVNRALKIDSNSIPSRLLGAQICLKMQRFDAAQEYLTKNLPNTNNPALQMMLASVETHQGNKTQANDRLLKIIKNHPRTTAAYFLLANSMKKKPVQWEALLKAGLKAQPDQWFLRHQLFTLLNNANRRDELQKAIGEFDIRNPTFKSSMRIAKFYFGIDNNSEMKKWLETAITRTNSSRQESRLFAFQADIALHAYQQDRNKSEKLLDARGYLKKAIKRNPRNKNAAERFVTLLTNNIKNNQEAFQIAVSLKNEFGLSRISKSTARFILDYYMANDPAKSREFIELLVVKRSGEPEWIYAKVELAIVENRIDKTLVEVKNIAEKQRWKPEPWLAVARLYEARNENTQAMDALFTAIKLQPQHIPSRLMIINLCQKAGLHQQVVIHTKAVLSKHPEMWRLYNQQLAALRKLGYGDEAKRIADNLKQNLNAAIRKNPNNFQAHRALVKLNFSRNELSAALAAVQFGRKQFPESKSFVYDEIRILLLLKQTAEGLNLAESTFKNANETDCLNIAQIFLEQQMFDNAYNWSKKGYAFNNTKSQIEFQELLGEISFHRGLKSGEKKWFLEAAGYYREMLAKYPNNWQAVNNLCWILSDRLNRLSDALTLAEDYRRKHTLRELNVEFIDTLATVYRKAFAYERNKDFLEEAIRLHPRHAGIRFELAMCYLELGKSTEGIRLLSNAMDLGLEDNRQQIAKRYLAIPVKSED